MHSVVRGVHFGAVLISGAACTLCTSRGHPDSNARESLHASNTGRYLQCCQCRMKLTHLGPESWLMKERLMRYWWLHVTVSVLFTPCFSLFRCFSCKSPLLTNPKSMQSSLSLILRFSLKSLLLTDPKCTQSSLSPILHFRLKVAAVDWPKVHAVEPLSHSAFPSQVAAVDWPEGHAAELLSHPAFQSQVARCCWLTRSWFSLTSLSSGISALRGEASRTRSQARRIAIATYSRASFPAIVAPTCRHDARIH